MTTQSSGLGDSARRSWRAFFVASNLLIEEIEAAMHTNGVVSLSEYDALQTLDQAPEQGLTIRELSAHLAITHSGLSRMLDRLEASGAIERTIDAHDKRAVRIRMLPEGRNQLTAAWQIYSSTVNEFFGRVLSPKEHTEMLLLSKKLSGPLIRRKERAAKSALVQKA